MKYWSISEESAYQKMADFIDYKLHDYPTKRDFMAEKATSGLSPYLCHGQISLATIIDALYDVKQENAKEAFIRQLIWREFNYYSLWHFPDMQHRNFNAKFDHFHWENNEHQLKLWQNGQTGYPIVDAGMRQLYETGYMHNRVRMIVGSFLTKHLLIDWRYGKKWFWYTLLDGDSAVNAYNWQWVAGCGVDPSPFFRVFNPWLQARKFDPEADYIKYWVPELKQLSKSIIHKPEKLKKHYFEPLVQHQYARTRALARFKQIKKDK
jgi:deoxyribodipyrimidine photo-lyase